MKVSENIICFLDILGYKNILENEYKNNEDELLEIINSVIEESYKIVNEISNKSESDSLSKIKFNTFSDNIVLSLEINEEFSIYDLLNYLRVISEISKLFPTKYNIVVRGGIVLGNYYCNSRLVFGSGLVKAYLAETNAVYPRVTISNAVIELYKGKLLEKYLFSKEKLFFGLVDSFHKKIYKKIFSEEFLILKNKLIDILRNMEVMIPSSHYKALDERAAQVIISFNNYREFVNSFEDTLIYENIKNELILYRKRLVRAFEDFKNIQFESFNIYMSEYIIKDDKNYYLNYLNSHSTINMYFKKSNQFPVFIKHEDGSFIYSAAIRDCNSVLFSQTCDGFLVKLDENIKKIINHKVLIEKNIKKFSINDCDNLVLEKYIWLKDYHNLFCNNLYKSKLIDKVNLEKILIKGENRNVC